ncbi:MAG: response regulator transcription factor [Chloroflexota bacterium]|jgi:DNA-binding NarL/FixJ family response regulator
MPDIPSPPITILIADDEELARAGIRTLLSQARDMEIIGEAQDGFEVQELVPKLRPKILLLDYRMPGPRAYELEKWVRENYPETTALVLTAHNRDEYLTKVIDAGMPGFLLKSENAERLIELVRRAARGETLFDQAQLNRAARWREETNKLNQLTPREREILELIKEGLDNNAIAQTLNISIKTAMYHTTNLFRKLQVKNRQEAALWALKYLPDNPEEYPG